MIPVPEISNSKADAKAFLSFTLHAHLPYVINHGTWPHGIEWLLEAAAETYLPLLRMFKRLETDGIALRCNLDLSPILLEQLVHPVFIAEFPAYLQRKIGAAREDESYFLQSGDQHLPAIARYWQAFYTSALDDFTALDSNIVAGFRHFNDTGAISIITSAATHGFLPLLGTDESVAAQINLAVGTHTSHLGRAPHGVWLPECGYRPAGFWDYPAVNDGKSLAPGFDRPGIEQALADANLNFFFVDTPLVDTAQVVDTSSANHSSSGLYQPNIVASKATPETIVFARDPRTAIQVWSGEAGYPADFCYLDFHKKRFPGGLRYWKVTAPGLDIAHKEPWYGQDAEARAAVHATHFASLVRETLSRETTDPNPPILNALFDAELFGHWWYEGILWLEAVARELHATPNGLSLIDCAHYLELYPPAPSTPAISMKEGSWGSGGSSQVWLNHETSWTYARLYPAELYVREIATCGKWSGSPLGTRIAQQLCRELLLLESSDWQFLITTGTARDYAESRFATHASQFDELRDLFQTWLSTAAISPEQDQRLAAIEHRDSIFANLDPALWATPAAVSNPAEPGKTGTGKSTARRTPASASA